MNVWKPIALVATVASVIFAGQSRAGASPAAGGTEPSSVEEGGQPHMRNALAQLRAARAELDKAEHDKGGWRVAAIREADQAIAETQRGIAFDQNH